MTITVRSDGMDLKPRKVFDRFLGRDQIRVMTDAEYWCLCGMFVNFAIVSGVVSNLLYVGAEVAPEYGSKKWRNG